METFVSFLNVGHCPISFRFARGKHARRVSNNLLAFRCSVNWRNVSSCRGLNKQEMAPSRNSDGFSDFKEPNVRCLVLN